MIIMIMIIINNIDKVTLPLIIDNLIIQTTKIFQKTR